MIEENTARCVQPVSLPVVARQLEAGHFTDAVGRARVEACTLGLRHLVGLAEHFTRTRKIKPAPRNNVLDGSQQVVGAVDIGIQSGKFIVKRIADETLGRQVIALVRLYRGHYLVNTGVTLERGGVQLYLRPDSLEARQPVLGIFNCHAAHNTVDVVSFAD